MDLCSGFQQLLLTAEQEPEFSNGFGFGQEPLTNQQLITGSQTTLFQEYRVEDIVSELAKVYIEQN